MTTRHDPPPRAGAWHDASPAREDPAAAIAERVDAGVRDGSLANLHAVLLMRDGDMVMERYYRGSDERWGRSLGQVQFDARTLHDLRSVTKSIVSLLYGIALAEGAVPPPDCPLLDALPRYADLAASVERRRITVADALTMRLGLAWDESLPYSDSRNSEHAMELAPDRCRYVLEQPVTEPPGTRWVYAGGATALLGQLIAAGTRMPLRDYARVRLFAPLGIDDFDWVTGADGVDAAASGLRLCARDLARIGQMVLDGGVHGGTRLVPEHWLRDSFEPHARVDGDLDYGYQWWIARRWNWLAAFGNGGQRLTVMPRARLVLVVMAGNYNAPDAWKVPVRVLTEAVLPSLGGQTHD